MAGVLGMLADLLEPPDDAFGLLGFEPNPGPQTVFLGRFEDPNTDQLYGGAAGGSKSTSLLLGTLRACRRYPGLQAFWFRRSFPELQHSVIRLLARYGYGKALGCRWNETKHTLHFPNGSTLTFAHAKNTQEATAYLSVEIQLLLLDERTTIPPDVVDLLYTRVRSGVPGLPCLGIRSATNPGGIGHSRVKAEYVDATAHGATVIERDRMGRRRTFQQAKVSDTPQLGPEYAAALAGMGEALAKAYLDGDWDVFAGQVFSEWRYDRHVVEPFALPEEWYRLGGIDYGYRAPSAVLWAAKDPDGRLWVYRELYQAQLGEKGLAAAVKAATGEETVAFAFDPAMSAKVGDATPSATILRAEGLPLRPADNDRLSGWQRVHTYLAEGPACAHHRAAGWDTCPMLHVFAGCTDLIRTLPALPYRETGKLEDADTSGEDHLPDALRYLVMSVGTTPTWLFSEDEPTSALDGSELAHDLGGGIAMRQSDMAAGPHEEWEHEAPRGATRQVDQ